MEDEPVFPAWAHTAEATAAHHGVDVAKGLTADQVEERRERYGYNELKKPPSPSIWALILQQFDDTLVKVRSSYACRFLFRPLPLQNEAGPCSLNVWESWLLVFDYGSVSKCKHRSREEKYKMCFLRGRECHALID
jgi:magnesium-transporting ATPase (P-type)